MSSRQYYGIGAVLRMGIGIGSYREYIRTPSKVLVQDPCPLGLPEMLFILGFVLACTEVLGLTRRNLEPRWFVGKRNPWVSPTLGKQAWPVTLQKKAWPLDFFRVYWNALMT